MLLEGIQANDEPNEIIGTGMDGWSSKLIGCRRLLTKGLLKAKGALSAGALSAGLQCVVLQYNWDVMIGRALLRGLQPSTSLVELRCIDKGETVQACGRHGILTGMRESQKRRQSP